MVIPVTPPATLSLKPASARASLLLEHPHMAEDKPVSLHARVTDAIGRFALPRMWVWLYLSIALVALVWIMAPHMVKVIVFKLSMAPIATVFFYWAHRTVCRGIPGPRELWTQANKTREEGNDERAWQLEKLMLNILLQRTILIGLGLIFLGLAA